MTGEPIDRAIEVLSEGVSRGDRHAIALTLRLAKHRGKATGEKNRTHPVPVIECYDDDPRLTEPLPGPPWKPGDRPKAVFIVRPRQQAGED